MFFLSWMSDEAAVKTMSVSRKPSVYFTNPLCPSFVKRSELLAGRSNYSRIR